MAEAALITVATNVLSTVASKPFEKGYERACSVWSARDDLDKLQSSIRTIHAGLLDAERKQEDDHLVKDWLKKTKDVLYEADDLFDEVATDDLLDEVATDDLHRRHGNGIKKLMIEVLLCCSRFKSLFISNINIANKVKEIRESLLAISNDMRPLNLVSCPHENLKSGSRKGQDPGSSVPKIVIGRDGDKNAILEMLLHDQLNDVQVIAIDGIGGMGKTTLTQLVYNHEEVEKCFEKRWFAWISDKYDDVEILGEIYQSMCGMSREKIILPKGILQTKIKESTEGKKFLLVLDDVWDDDHDRWQNRLSLLSRGAKGSKIVVSTRSGLVARAVDASKTYRLNGLSKEDSWALFKRVVSFTPEQEEDSRWTYLGREIVQKCANVPLAIKCIANLLFEKNTIQEWESIRNEKLPWLGQRHKDGIMPVLKLSYQHLPSNLKHCFAYCSLFPKDHSFDKEKLTKLWIAQGYVNPDINETQMMEDEGHSYFMYLVRRSFFQPLEYFHQEWKMHDLIHDLAIHVAGEESLMLTSSSKEISSTRHVSVDYVVDNSWLLPKPLHSVNRLRSLFFLTSVYSGSILVLGEQFANVKALRALSLRNLGIENIPSLIGELKHLRYLDISDNRFKKLPDSITKLVNLCTLNITDCRSLGEWPDNFRNLINLRHLHNTFCISLKHMPPGSEELASLQQLDEFIVGKGMDGVPMSKLDVLSELKLRGKLEIRFEDGANDWVGVECWQPPLTLQRLKIRDYAGERIPQWSNGRTTNPSLLPNLTSLTLIKCKGAKYLPPFKHIPKLKHLSLWNALKLEYIQDDEAGSDELFIPDLETLEFRYLPKLKGWSRKGEHHSSSTSSYAPPPARLLEFPNLLDLKIHLCEEMEWWGENNSGVDWDSFRKLNTISLRSTPSSFRIPDCLVRLQELGQLKIDNWKG